MPCPRTQQAVDTIVPKLWITFLKVFWYDSTREMNPRSTDCEAVTLTTTPLHWLYMMRHHLNWIDVTHANHEVVKQKRVKFFEFIQNVTQTKNN